MHISIKCHFAVYIHCLEKTCPPIVIGSPTVTVNPKLCQKTPEFDQVCIFECKDGYDVDMDMVHSICNADGTWSNPTPDASYCRGEFI